MKEKFDAYVLKHLCNILTKGSKIEYVVARSSIRLIGSYHCSTTKFQPSNSLSTIKGGSPDFRAMLSLVEQLLDGQNTSTQSHDSAEEGN